MATNKFKFVLKTPEKTLYDGDVVDIMVRSEGGFLQAMARHADLTASVQFSGVRINHGDGLEEFVVRRGILAFDNANNKASLLVLHGEAKADIDLVTAKEYLDFIEEQIKNGGNLSDFQLKYLENERLAVEMQLAE